jgi:hypothetical protein
MFSDDELIKKEDIFDPIEDDYDIDWKQNPILSMWTHLTREVRPPNN